MRAPVAELHSVSRSFELEGKSVSVLRDLNLSLHAGDRVVLFGPSGCGKTTLLHLLALLDEVTEGTVSLEGQEVTGLSETEKAQLRATKIGLVFQRFHLLPFHSVMENIQLRTRYLPDHPPPAPERIRDLLRQMDLTDLADHPVRFLSGGEQQRVCIARALLQPPSLFLADEPTGNLDEANSENVRRLFESLDASIPVVIATHDPGWLSFATRILRFDQGRLVPCNENIFA